MMWSIPFAAITYSTSYVGIDFSIEFCLYGGVCKLVRGEECEAIFWVAVCSWRLLFSIF